jgi:hypothetical protein
MGVGVVRDSRAGERDAAKGCAEDGQFHERSPDEAISV